MRRLDRIVEFMKKQQGKRFVMRSDDTCLLFTEQGRQPLNQLMSRHEIEAVLGEVVPDELKPKLTEEGAFVFPYPSPQGELTVGVIRHNGSLEVTVGLPGESVIESHSSTTLHTVTMDNAPPPRIESAVVPERPDAPAATATSVPTPTVTPRAAPATAVSIVTPLRTAKISFPSNYLPDIFRVALEREASDIHLRGGMPPRLRIHGNIQELTQGEILSAEQLQAALFELIPVERQREWLESGTVEFAITFEDRARLRCALFTERAGVAAGCRLLPLEPPTIESVHLPPVVSRLAKMERGLVIVSGPQSSGRSTTLAAIIALIKTERHGHIVTLESPIEFIQHPHQSLVTQRETPTHVRSFPEGLRNLSQMDVDVCMVSDLTQPETLRAAFEAAQSGLLVMGALGRPDVHTTVEFIVSELLEHGITRETMASVLRAVVCQRLCKQKDGKALVPVFEALVVIPAVATLFRDDSLRELHSMMLSGAEGMLTFEEGLLHCVQEDKISVDEAMNQSLDPEGLRLFFTRNRIKV